MKTHEIVFHPAKPQPAIIRLSTGGGGQLLYIYANTQCFDSLRTVTEDSNLHLKEFFVLCKFRHIQGLTPKGIRLVLFPFSLKDNAKLWYNSLPADSIHTWEELATKFLKKFFSAQNTRQLKRELQSF